MSVDRERIEADVREARRRVERARMQQLRRLLEAQERRTAKYRKPSGIDKEQSQ